MVTTGNPPVDLNMTAGLPYSRRFRVNGGTSIWPTLDLFEIRSDIRLGKDEMTPLVGRLVDYLSATIEGDDIVVDLELTGAQTRLVARGYYDIILSDPGPEDARALPLAAGKVKVSYLRTAAADE